MLTQEEIIKAKSIKLADNFTLYEMIRSSSHPSDVFYPEDNIVALLEKMAGILQKIRNHFGVIHVHSAFRNPIINSKVGGVPNSVHQYILNGETIGEAADLSPDFNEHTLEDVFHWIIDNHKDLEIKTAIIYRKPEVVKYGSRFIHIDTRIKRPKFIAMEKWAPGDYRLYERD